MMSDNENEKRETVADIVAMVRRAAQYYDGEAEKSEGLLRETFKLSAANYRAIADLVDAAWKREKAEADANALAVGNAAAMREALVLCSRIIGANGIRGNVFLDDIQEAHRAITAALSAPPRNCDLYQDKKDAEVAFISEECRHPCGNCTVCDKYGSVLVHECGVDWLFAAAERKGEGDGR